MSHPSDSPTRRLAWIAGAIGLVAIGALALVGLGDRGGPEAGPPPAPAPASDPEPAASLHPWRDAARTEHGEGLASAVLVEGTGPSPAAGQVVELDVQGWLEANGSLVAHEAGARRRLGAGEMVEGIERLLPTMKVGETRQIRVPAALGFGQTGRPPRIPRDADLVYEVALKAVDDARPVPDAPPAAEPDQESGGVRWVRLAEGAGEPLPLGARARAHVSTWLPDGTRIDSTLERQRPIAVRIGQGELYPGLDRALAEMRPGERRKLVVPPALAAGTDGRGPIPPDTPLIFDVELLPVE